MIGKRPQVVEKYVIRRVKVKSTLLPASRKAQRGGSRGIALFNLPLDRGGWLTAPAVLYKGKVPGTCCMVGWVGPRACLDEHRKSFPYRDPIHGLSSP